MRNLTAIAVVACCLCSLSCYDGAVHASSTITNTGSPSLKASAYPNLQAAIDAIPSTGGTLIIDGQYEASGQACFNLTGQYGPCIYQRRNISIVGDGVTSKIYTTASNIIGLYILASDMISVSGVEFAGPWMPGQPPDVAVAVRVDDYGDVPGTRVTVENCRVHNFPFDGLWARNLTSQIHFLHNESYDNLGNGIEIEAQDSSVLDNDIHDNVHQGIEVYSSAQRLRLANNRFYNNLEGIKLIEDPTFPVLSQITIVGNQANNNHDTGILFQGTPPVSPAGSITIMGNSVTANDYGIQITEAGTGFVIADNVVSGNASIDISISQANNIVIANNVLTVAPGSPLSQYGIFVQPGSSGITLDNNVVANSANVPVLNQEQQVNRQGAKLRYPLAMPQLQAADTSSITHK